MSDRLSRITTRTGDDGTTGLADGSRVGKAGLRVTALGDIDELNAHIGLLRAGGNLSGDPSFDALLEAIQHDLFDLGGEISLPGLVLLKTERVAALDEWLASANATLPALAEFILPGGTVPAAQAHVCRTVCRRVERAMVALSDTEHVADTCVQYLNRLSDAMFVLARMLSRQNGGTEPQWRHDRGRN